MKYLHLAAWIIFGVCSGCSQNARLSPQVPESNTHSLVTANSVGEYELGKSTLSQTLGTDSTENRSRFADAGLHFEFNHGQELTGVTVTSSNYALANGITIGTAANQVVAQLGEPLARSLPVTPKGFDLEALVYDDFAFLLDEKQNVAAIRVGN